MPQYLASVRAIGRCVLDGVVDSLRLRATLVFFLSSTTVRVRTAHCVLLNGVLFLGSLLLADLLLAPILRALLQLGGIGEVALVGHQLPLSSADIPLPDHASASSAGQWLNVFFLYAYQLLWIYPLYALSFILNAIFYQDVADHAFITHGGRAAPAARSFDKWVRAMSDELYRLMLVTAFMLQITAVSFIPYIGNALVMVHLCWLYSLYSFEYKWALRGWSLEYRLKYFERHWAYFLGFGSPAVLLSVIFPKFISLGIFALSFPVFIILAIIAHPTSHAQKMRKEAEARAANKATVSGGKAAKPLSVATVASGTPAPPAIELDSTQVWLYQLPIFRIATWINLRLLRVMQARSKAAVSRRLSLDPNDLKPLRTAAAQVEMAQAPPQ